MPTPAAPIVGAHAAAAVDEQHDALIALVLELAHDRLVEAQRRLPVDVPNRIAVAILGELLEVRALAALLKRLDADFLQPPVAGEPCVARDLGEIRIHAAHLGRRRGARASSHKPSTERTRASAGANVISPRRVGVTRVRRIDALAVRQHERVRQALRDDARIDVVVKLHAQSCAPSCSSVARTLRSTPIANAGGNRRVKRTFAARQRRREQHVVGDGREQQHDDRGGVASRDERLRDAGEQRGERRDADAGEQPEQLAARCGAHRSPLRSRRRPRCR